MLLGGCLACGLFLWYVYLKQYRFASKITDMLPYYPLLVVICLLGVLVSVIVLVVPFSPLFLLMIPSLIAIYGVQFVIFRGWFSSYRITNLRSFFQRLLDSSKIQVISIDEWLSTPKKDPSKIKVVVRHDVDVDLKRAQHMMQLDQEFNIPACFYIRNNAERYTFEQARSIFDRITESSLFEIGFHYESISKSRGNLEESVKLFLKEVEQFRRFYPVRLVCPHGVPNYHNGLIEKRNLLNFAKLGLFSPWSLPYDSYIHDSGGLHRFKTGNSRKTFLRILEDVFFMPLGSLVQINIHPDWWF